MTINEKKRVLKEALEIIDVLGDLNNDEYFVNDNDSYVIDEDLENLITRANKLKKSRVWKLR